MSLIFGAALVVCSTGVFFLKNAFKYIFKRIVYLICFPYYAVEFIFEKILALVFFSIGMLEIFPSIVSTSFKHLFSIGNAIEKSRSFFLNLWVNLLRYLFHYRMNNLVLVKEALGFFS